MIFSTAVQLLSTHQESQNCWKYFYSCWKHAHCIPRVFLVLHSFHHSQQYSHNYLKTVEETYTVASNTFFPRFNIINSCLTAECSSRISKLLKIFTQLLAHSHYLLHLFLILHSAGTLASHSTPVFDSPFLLPFTVIFSVSQWLSQNCWKSVYCCLQHPNNILHLFVILHSFCVSVFSAAERPLRISELLKNNYSAACNSSITFHVCLWFFIFTTTV